MAAGGRYEFGHYRLDVRAHLLLRNGRRVVLTPKAVDLRSEEHTSELQSRLHLVCRLLLEKKKSRMFEYVLDRLDESLVTADENGKLLLWIPAAEKRLGLGAVALLIHEMDPHYGCCSHDAE